MKKTVLQLKPFTILLAVSFITIFLLAFVTTGQAVDKGDITAELTAYTVLVKTDGTEELRVAKRVKPGDLVLYRTEYRNQDQASVTNLVATLPVPEGMSYLPQTATPAVTTASLDGKRFAPVPLMRWVRLSNGDRVQRQVPYTEYRFLRWRLDTLAAGDHAVVQARMSVNPVGNPSTVIPSAARAK